MFFDPDNPDVTPIDLEGLTDVATLKIPPTSSFVILERTDLTATEWTQTSRY